MGCVPGLNAIPLLEEYRASPQGNVHLLLTGLGAVAGQLTNLDLQGQPSMGFHGDPAVMRHDPYRCHLCACMHAGSALAQLIKSPEPLLVWTEAAMRDPVLWCSTAVSVHA